MAVDFNAPALSTVTRQQFPLGDFMMTPLLIFSMKTSPFVTWSFEAGASVPTPTFPAELIRIRSIGAFVTAAWLVMNRITPMLFGAVITNPGPDELNCPKSLKSLLLKS